MHVLLTVPVGQPIQRQGCSLGGGAPQPCFPSPAPTRGVLAAARGPDGRPRGLIPTSRERVAPGQVSPGGSRAAGRRGRVSACFPAPLSLLREAAVASLWDPQVFPGFDRLGQRGAGDRPRPP